MNQTLIYRKIALPMYRQIYNFIRDEIENGTYTNQLPPERKLMQKYNVSRVTIRKVLGLLEERNIISRQRGKGTFIALKNSPKTKNKHFRIICMNNDYQNEKKSDPLNFFIFSRIMNGIMTAAVKFENTFDIVGIREVWNNANIDFIRNYDSISPDGFIFIGCQKSPLVEGVRKSGIPYIVIGDQGIIKITKSDYNLVCSNAEEGAFNAVYHLLSEGRNKIGYIGPVSGFLNCFKKRYEGYARALASFDIKLNSELIEECPGTAENGYTAMKNLLSRFPDINAIFAVTDLRAWGAVKAIKESKLQIPDDIAVIGFDNLDESASSKPSLSSVDSQLKEQGAIAVNLLNNYDKVFVKKQTILKMVETKIYVRESSQKPDKFSGGLK